MSDTPRSKIFTSAEGIAVILAITTSVILISTIIIPVWRGDAIPPPVMEMISENMNAIIGGLLLFVGNKMKNVL